MEKPKTKQSRQKLSTTNMAQMIKKGDLLIRINPQNPKELESSRDGGRQWHRHSQNWSSGRGNFLELFDENGNELSAQTSGGLFISTDGGKMWRQK